jgi:hypothetical protein
MLLVSGDTDKAQAYAMAVRGDAVGKLGPPQTYGIQVCLVGSFRLDSVLVTMQYSDHC